MAGLLVSLDVPVSFHVYAGEGHGMRKEIDRDDMTRRAMAWFDRWFAAPATGVRHGTAGAAQPQGRVLTH